MQTIVFNRIALRWAAMLVVVAGTVAAAGCRGRGYDGERRAAVSGTVTLRGEPIDGGVIQFVPIAGDGRKASASIVQGRYDIPEVRGPNLGAHRVMVNWPKPTGEVLTEEEGLETVEIVPPEFHENSTLEVELNAGRNTHNFEL